MKTPDAQAKILIVDDESFSIKVLLDLLQDRYRVVVAKSGDQALRRVAQVPAPDLNLLDKTSPLHDIGKVGVPDRILLKPGRLDPDEWEEMKRYAESGYCSPRARGRRLHCRRGGACGHCSEVFRCGWRW